MLFSIIVPIYNVEPYLDRCVESLINQTYRDIEIILVDDESPDRCPEMCDKYAEKDPRIKVIHKKNGGLSDARNAGISVASGEYLIFVDADDYVERDLCKRMVPFAQKGYDILIGDAIVEGGAVNLEHISMNKIMSGEEYLLEAYRNNKTPMAVWLNIVNRKFLLANNLFFKFGILHEDEEFTPRMLLKAQTVACTGVVFYHYIIRENSITTKKDKRKNANDLYDTCCELAELYAGLESKELKTYLLDSLSVKYLSMFQSANLCQYGNKYLHKDFVFKNAKRMKTKCKGILYCMSPKLYYLLNKRCKEKEGKKDGEKNS